MPIKVKAYAVGQLGIIGLPTVCYDPRQARKQAIASEREYMNPQDNGQMDDAQVWRRLYRQGFRVIPVTIVHS